MSENKKKVVVFDYGFGNVRSAERALARVGADVEITRDYDRAMAADGLLVPGVGAFAACMEGLKRARGDWIVGRRLVSGRPVMGICVGMQILFERGIEHGVETEGLDEWPGTVGPLKADVVPHMGWNTVDAPEDSRLFSPWTRTRATTSCTPTRRTTGPSKSPTPRSVPPGSRGPRTANGSWPPWRTARCGPPSSTPRSPAMPPSC